MTRNAEVEATVASVTVRKRWGQSTLGNVTAVGLGLLRVPFAPLTMVVRHAL